MSDKTKQKKLAARKEKIRQDRHRVQSRTTNPKKLQTQAVKKLFPDKEMQFWAANGVNHLMSSYSEGTWTPLFPEIYSEDAALPDYEQMATAIVQKAGEGEWSNECKAALAWITQPRDVVFGFYVEALKAQKEKLAESETINKIREPHNPIFWEKMDAVLQKMK